MTDAGATDAHGVELMLTVAGQQTVLAFEERGIPPEQLAAYGAGNQIHLEDLAAHLKGAGRCDSRKRWAELQPSYGSMAIETG